MRTTKAHCNTCDGERNHFVLHEERSSWTDDQNSMQGSETDQMLKCGGCDSIKLRKISWDTESEGKRVFYFPPARSRREPKWMLMLWLELPDEEKSVEEILKEIYSAHYQGLLRLAAMGVRSLIESIMISKIGDNASFHKNMDEFQRFGYVSDVQRTRLAALLEAGHATIHRAYAPSAQDVDTLIDIAEHIIESVYVHGDQVAKLKERIPPRKPRGEG